MGGNHNAAQCHPYSITPFAPYSREHMYACSCSIPLGLPSRMLRVLSAISLSFGCCTCCIHTLLHCTHIITSAASIIACCSCRFVAPYISVSR